jgi:ribosomal protein S18 acetylase RimI-like enzyme
MRMMGLEVCHLDALGDNLPAVKFYEKFGFETSGRSIVHYEDLGDVEVYMFEYDLKKISC